MQSGVSAVAESLCWSQNPGLGGLSMGFTRVFCALFPDFANTFQCSCIPIPATDSQAMERRERKPRVQSMPKWDVENKVGNPLA